MVDLGRYFILSVRLRLQGAQIIIVRLLGTSTWLLANTLWRLVDERLPRIIIIGSARLSSLSTVAGFRHAVLIGNATALSSLLHGSRSQGSGVAKIESYELVPCSRVWVILFLVFFYLGTTGMLAPEPFNGLSSGGVLSSRFIWAILVALSVTSHLVAQLLQVHSQTELLRKHALT